MVLNAIFFKNLTIQNMNAISSLGSEKKNICIWGKDQMWSSGFSMKKCLSYLNPLKSELFTKQACRDAVVVSSLFFSPTTHTHTHTYIYIQSVKFKQVNNPFLNKLKEDTDRIKNEPKLLIAADKTTYFYKLEPSTHNDLLEKTSQNPIRKRHQRPRKQSIRKTKTSRRNWESTTGWKLQPGKTHS